MAHRISNLSVGLQKTSTVDFPGTVAATIFFTGCNLRCPFCHNPLLAQGLTPLEFQPLDEALAAISRRASVLGGVCITGGEPLLQPGLSGLVAEIRSFGLPVKIDTNGLAHERLAEIDPDYTAVDLKTSPARYSELAAVRDQPCGQSGIRPSAVETGSVLFERVRRTMEYLRSAGKAYEYRTTVVPGLVDRKEFDALCSELLPGERWFLQRFRPDYALSPRYRSVPPTSAEELVALRDYATRKGIACEVRGSNH